MAPGRSSQAKTGIAMTHTQRAGTLASLWLVLLVITVGLTLNFNLSTLSHYRFRPNKSPFHRGSSANSPPEDTRVLRLEISPTEHIISSPSCPLQRHRRIEAQQLAIKDGTIVVRSCGGPVCRKVGSRRTIYSNT